MRNRYNLKNFLNQDRKILYMVLSILLVSVLTLTVVYAALSTTLNINGNAEVTAASWDIYLDNVKLNSNSATTIVPTISNKTTASFSTTLTKPGDFYEFTVDVVNNGSIDAMIDGVTKTPELSGTQAKYINYIVEYENGQSVSTKQLVSKNSFVRLKVKVEYRKDISVIDLPSSSESLNLSFKVNYVQSDDSDENITVDNNGKLIKIVGGDYDTVGSEVCIGEECFYVISSDEDNVLMLAKYNLYVGNHCTSSSTCTAYGDEATGMQDSTMIGLSSNLGYPRYGTTEFSSDSQKGTNYNDYSGSIVEGYVNNYKTYLEDMGATIDEARLITKDELVVLGCSAGGETCRTSSYAWTYSTSYWLGSAIGSYNVWCVSNSSFDDGRYFIDYTFGVRPVIKISKSEF